MKLPIQKGKEVIFRKEEAHQGYTLRNQEKELSDFRDADIRDFLADMFDTPDQFVVLAAPRAQYKVRFVQACTHEGAIEIEIGIEEEGTRLFYKICSEEECCRIFLDFYENTFIPEMEEYKPVEFL